MTHKRTYTLAEVAGLTGIPAEEVHARLWKGELPGDGNVAMPGSRTTGTVNAETLARLEQEGRLRSAAPTPAPQPTRQHFQAVPLAHAAQELGIPQVELEQLLVKGELEGPVLNHRFTGVTHASLEAYRERRRFQEAVEASLIPAPADVTARAARQGVKVEYLSIDALKRLLSSK